MIEDVLIKERRKKAENYFKKFATDPHGGDKIQKIS